MLKFFLFILPLQCKNHADATYILAYFLSRSVPFVLVALNEKSLIIRLQVNSLHLTAADMQVLQLQNAVHFSSFYTCRSLCVEVSRFFFVH